MRVVIDCNIFISFVLSHGETLSFFFLLWEKNYFVAYISKEIEEELNEVLNRLIAKNYLPKKQAEDFLEFVKINTIKIKTISDLKLSKDKKDNRYLNLAKDVEADFLVTGDKKHLLNLGKLNETKIINAHDFVKMFQAKRRKSVKIK